MFEPSLGLGLGRKVLFTLLRETTDMIIVYARNAESG